MKRRLGLTALVAASFCGGTSAFADAVPTFSGPIYLGYSNAEQFAPGNNIGGYSAVYGSPNSGTCLSGTCGEGNWGILEVSGIAQGTALSPKGSDVQGGGSALFTNGQNGGDQILGIWYGVHNDTNTANSTTSSGGVMDLYYWTGSSQNVGTDLSSSASLANRTAQNQYTGYTCVTNTANCTFLAQLDFVYGSNGAADTQTTITTPTDPATHAGDAASYLAVDTSVVGAWTSMLNTNYFTLDPNNVPLPDTPDVRLDSNFTANGASAWSIPGDGIFGLASHDPARAVVPEPSTLALFGSAILLLGTLRWRRRNRA